MRVYLCNEVNAYGEPYFCKAFVDRTKARKWFLECVERETHGNLHDIDIAVREAAEEFDNYIPRLMDAECDVAVVNVIETED